MKKNILTLLVVLFLTVPFVTQAAYNSYTEGKGLVPCGNTTSTGTDGTSTISDPCTICYFITGIHRLLSFGFMIIIVAATVAIVFAGIMYIVSTGDPGAMESAKGFVKAAVIGVAIMLLAWLIITTVMNILSAKSNLGITSKSWKSFDCK